MLSTLELGKELEAIMPPSTEESLLIGHPFSLAPKYAFPGPTWAFRPGGFAASKVPETPWDLG